jgi:ubiquinone/menaquinone biosynthesis C-methylase UbiE
MALERQHVNLVYNAIAHQFDKTRTCRWKGVAEFLDSLPSGSYIGDVGCGNGKYAQYRSDLVWSGMDMSEALANIARDKADSRGDVMIASGIHLPYRDKTFDATMSIAVLHHISTKDRRKKFLQELLRVTTGSILVTVWAREQCLSPSWVPIGSPESNDYMIPWKDANLSRYYHLFPKEEVVELVHELGIRDYNLTYERDNWFLLILPDV